MRCDSGELERTGSRSSSSFIEAGSFRPPAASHYPCNRFQQAPTHPKAVVGRRQLVVNPRRRHDLGSIHTPHAPKIRAREEEW